MLPKSAKSESTPIPSVSLDIRKFEKKKNYS